MAQYLYVPGSFSLGMLEQGIGGINGVIGGPYLLQTDGLSRILLVNGTDKLLITGTDPAGAYVPTYYLLGF